MVYARLNGCSLPANYKSLMLFDDETLLMIALVSFFDERLLHC